MGPMNGLIILEFAVIVSGKKIAERLTERIKINKFFGKSLQNYRRVHIGNYVLIYSINEKKKTIIIERYKHHDEIYLGEFISKHLEF